MDDFQTNIRFIVHSRLRLLEKYREQTEQNKTGQFGRKEVRTYTELFKKRKKNF
jgi:hypothetical protein